jgi:hypothetical protein
VPSALPPRTNPGPIGSGSPSPAPEPSPPQSIIQLPGPSSSDSPVPADGGAIGQIGSGGAANGGGDGTHLEIGGLPAGGAVRLDDIGALGTTAMVAWLVPGLLLSLPSLLIVLVVAFQAGFATAFVPVTRRALGGGRRRRARESHGPMPRSGADADQR